MRRRAVIRLLSAVLGAVLASTSAEAQNLFDGCPLQGTTKLVRVQQLNMLKNRFAPPGPNKINQAITLEAMLAPGDDSQRWSAGMGAIVTGFVVDVRPGGPETVNCKAKDVAHTDAHIELAINPNNTNANQIVVVEVTPRVRGILASKGKDYTTATLRKVLIGKWIRVRGWMMFDAEHWNMAENTAPGHEGNWRATAWEIHPVTAIQIVPQP